jgi:hypothetical protein
MAVLLAYLKVPLTWREVLVRTMRDAFSSHSPRASLVDARITAGPVTRLCSGTFSTCSLPYGDACSISA